MDVVKLCWVIKMANRRYELTDEQWERVKDMIQHSKMGRPAKDDRLMLNAMFWLARSGAGWEDLPERYGPWKTVYSRFCKWRDDGTLLRIFQSLNEDADMENLSLDSTVIKAHPHSAGAIDMGKMFCFNNCHLSFLPTRFPMPPCTPLR